MRIVFWQNLLAFYQLAHMNALSRLGHEVVWVSEESISDERRSQGWFLPEYSNIEVCLAPDSNKIDEIIQSDQSRSVHIFSGIHGFPIVRQAFLRCLSAPVSMGLLIENRDSQGWRGKVRRLMYFGDYLKYGKRISFILSMGYTGKHGGKNWYKSCGYPESKIFPYCYFVENNQKELSNYSNSSEQKTSFQILFLGQMIHRKGIDILLKAAKSVSDLNWKLRIMGSGELTENLKQLSDTLGISERVEFIPAQPNDVAMKYMQEADLFILPSRFDGWGVVVNEALLRGVPVICSDRCGAQDLLGAPWRGDVFRSESVEDLSAKMRSRISAGPKTASSSTQIVDWTENISGDAAARYLIQVIESITGDGRERPSAPWL